MYKVVVKEIGTDKEVHSVSCGDSKRKAEKVENGMNANMDRERFYTEIVSDLDSAAEALSADSVMPMMIDGLKDSNDGIDTAERMLSFVLG